MMRTTCFALTIALALGSLPNHTHGAAIVSGFDSSTLARNDDGSTGLVSIGFDVNFLGVTFSQLYVNNNGNVTFDDSLSEYTPFDLTSTGRQIIAPFFADVDTRSSGGGDPVTYGSGTFDGRDAFGVNWVNVDHYSAGSSDNRNSFQLILADRSDIDPGDFDIIFNYDQIQWEAGTASDSDDNGRGGDSARVGFSNGTGNPGTSFELPGSAINGAFLDGSGSPPVTPGANSLIDNSLNSDVLGRYIFEARNGTIPPGVIPEPSSLAIFGINAFGLLFVRRHRRKICAK